MNNLSGSSSEQHLSLEMESVLGDLNQKMRAELMATEIDGFYRYIVGKSSEQLSLVLRYFAGEKNLDLPDYYPQTMSEDVPFDRDHILQLLSHEQDSPNSDLIITTAALARILYNQVKYSQKSLLKMDQESTKNYRHIAKVIFSEQGDKHYTDAIRARGKLSSILTREQISPASLHLIAGVGAGEVELASLINDLQIPASRVIACDILPRNLLGSDGEVSLTQQLSNKIHLFDNTDVIALANKLRSRFGNFLSTITSMGSSMVNHESAAKPLELFTAFSNIQSNGKILIYETRNYEIDPAHNDAFRATMQFTFDKPALPRGAKGILPAYLSEGQSEDNFGALLQSYFMIRAISALTGYSFEDPILANPKLALDFMQYPEWADNPSSPIWKPQKGNYRTLYALRKTANPHPLSQILIKSFHQAFARRFPEDLALLH